MSKSYIPGTLRLQAMSRFSGLCLAGVSCIAGVGSYATSARATTLTVYAGPQSSAFDVSLTATSLAFPTGTYALVSTFSTAPSGDSAIGATNSVGGGTFDYDFSLGYKPSRSPYVDLTLSATSGNMFADVTSFKVFDLSQKSSTGNPLQVTSVKWSGPSAVGPETLKGMLFGVLSGGKNLMSTSADEFEIQLVLAKGANGTFGATGSVPVPGALVLFGSSLLALGLLSAKTRRPSGSSLA